MTYYIYEIPGIKIGCTTHFSKREKQQSSKGKMVLLETHTDIKKASEREQQLQLQKGYRVDSIPYWFVTEVLNPLSNTLESKKKMSYKAKERCKQGWSSPNRFSWTVENNPNKGKLKGKDNPKYGTGVLYKELTSGFKGTWYEMKVKFPGWQPQMVTRKKYVKTQNTLTVNGK